MHETECTPEVPKRAKKAQKKRKDSVNLVINLKETGEISFSHDVASENDVYLIIAIMAGLRDGNIYREICIQSPEIAEIMKDDMWDGEVPYVDLTDDTLNGDVE